MGARPRLKSVLASLVAVAVLAMVLAAPTAGEPADAGWRGEYFANPNLVGPPVVVRTDATLDFNWGTGTPAPGIPTDNFSVRWTRTLRLDAGRYRFVTETDDGVRLYIDNRLLLNQWYRMSPTQHYVEIDLDSGVHTVRMEYFDATGIALARLWWYRVEVAPTPQTPISGWRGEYFNNRFLVGPPVLVRDDPAINFSWGLGAPAPGLPADDFSVRWTRTLHFEAGQYRFYTRTDDGVRLYVDGQLVIDEWRDMPPTLFWADVSLSAGAHTVIMEYYEARGAASAGLSWAKLPAPDQPITEWRGEYYNNRGLEGVPVFIRNDREITFDWGHGAPDPRLQHDNFSVRWTRTLSFQEGRYEFITETDDGVRLYVDNRLIIDMWRMMARTRVTKRVYLKGGTHTIRMEYFEAHGPAFAKLRWRGPIPLPTRGNLITCVPPYPSFSWIKVYQLTAEGTWLDVNRGGWGSINRTGYLKIDGLPVDYYRYGYAGHPYRVEQWVNGRLARSVGNIHKGEPEFRIRPETDNYTPWQCPPP